MAALNHALLVRPVDLPATSADDTAELSARLVAGDEAAWNEFHSRTFDRLLRYLLLAARGNEDAAREALQLTYIKCVRHVRRFPAEGAMWGWLKQIARGCLIDLARGRSRYGALLVDLAATPAAGADDDASGNELAELLPAGLAQLNPAERALVEARYTQNQPLTEIADATGTTRKAVESRLARIRARLRVWLTIRARHER
jgi:RNA polymerase sigma factor (sigma-70 family)